MRGIVPLKGRTVEVLSKEEILQIHQAVLEVLKDPGVKIEHEEALEILGRAGAEIDQAKQIAHIPSFLVERALAQAPHLVTLYGRDSRYDIKIGSGEVHFGNGHGASWVVDFDTGERRPATKKDLENLTRIHDALENTHCLLCEIIAQDVPTQALSRHTCQAMVNNTEKPLYLQAFDGKGAKDAIRMGIAIAGSEEALRRRPMYMLSIGVVSPLLFERERVDVLLEACRFGLPLQVYSIPAAGGTAPVTLAGTLVMQIAELLAGVTLGQLVRPGIPILPLGICSIMDQKYGSFTFACPEKALMAGAIAQILRYCGLPPGIHGATTNANVLDAQVGYETGVMNVFSALSGGGMICEGTASAIENTRLSVYEQAAIGNEICGMVYRVLRGIEVTPDTLAVNVIREVGPGGQFLAHSHTREHYRLENWEPKLSNRMTREEWEESGARDVREMAREEVKRILATHHPKPLDKDVQKKLQQIVKEAEGA